MPLPRLFVGNFDFEHRLADPQRVLPRRVNELNADLAWSWLALAREGDLVWLPCLSREGAALAEAHTFQDAGTISGSAGTSPSRPSVRFVTDWRDVESAVELVPWGWTDELLLTARVKHWQPPAIDPSAVKCANSRRTSAEWESRWQVGLPYATPCQSMDDVATAIAALTVLQRWVVKAEFGMSGRERQLGQGPLTTAAAHWMIRRLATDGVVFFEPWVERLDEVGILFDVPAEGEPVLVGVAPMLIAPGGHYRGSWFVRPSGNDVWWTEAIPIATNAARELQAHGYVGPLGIDAMHYRLADGRTGVRPLQDINARWTMGRLAWHWRERIPAATCGYWWHGPRAAFDAGEHLAAWSLSPPPQTLVTTPENVGHTAVLVWA